MALPHKRDKCGMKTTSGGICKLPAGHNTEHPGYGACARHGGRQPSHNAAAAKVKAVEHTQELRRLGYIEEHIDPETVMLQEVSRAAGAVAYFDQLMSQVDLSDEEIDGKDLMLIELWNEQRRLLRDVSKAAIQAGVAKRAIEIMEIQANMMVTALMAVISDRDLSLSPDQQGTARRLMAQQLRMLPIAAAPGDVIDA